jgi:hypothetical protein
MQQAEVQRRNEEDHQVQHDIEQENFDQHNAQQAANNQAAHEAQVQHNQQEVIEHNVLQQIPTAHQPYHDPASRHTIGPMNVECPKCHASHFKMSGFQDLPETIQSLACAV